ncbi:MAG TPA: maleylpyruvate isomerase N-terminal domain-containing protein [Chitinophagaceae bacterium]|nr:maleylpyruvate isomerase N-terminal domain-containing protein [Chitinophagaceae bacterium]
MTREPIHTLHLFPILNEKLVTFLEKLSPAEWQAQTIARKWVVKDVVSHLLDTSLRRIAIHRDKWMLLPNRAIESHDDLVSYLNELNADWVNATRRLSPRMLIDWLRSANETVYGIFMQLDPYGTSVFPVNWAGENSSFNWFDIAREYTERWLHQQQIRDAVGNRELLSPELYKPLLDVFMQAWPHTLRNTATPDGTLLKTTVTGEGGGDWWLVFEEGEWRKPVPGAMSQKKPAATTIIDGDAAWKLFSRSWRKEDAAGSVRIEGEERLGEIVLDMISVMA